MSAGYASRLKDYPNKGVCGLPETTETARAYQMKVEQLAGFMRQSKHTVVLTGAGISTSAGIPDFRGPAGIWTLEQKRQQRQQQQQQRRKRKRPGANETPTATTATATTTADVDDENNDDCDCVMDFAAAQPTFTHRSLTRLAADGVVQFVVTQNVDGLHRRSGLSRERHSVLHGCAFTEKCQDCKTEHFRDADVGGMSFQTTGRRCELCRGDLRDTLLDWEDPLPIDDLERSELECQKADLAICLGTSLRIAPANQLPLRAQKMVIVNLQRTPLDARAALVLRERVDRVMADVLDRLGYASARDDDGDGECRVPEIERLWKLKPAEKDPPR